MKIKQLIIQVSVILSVTALVMGPWYLIRTAMYRAHPEWIPKPVAVTPDAPKPSDPIVGPGPTSTPPAGTASALAPTPTTVQNTGQTAGPTTTAVAGISATAPAIPVAIAPTPPPAPTPPVIVPPPVPVGVAPVATAEYLPTVIGSTSVSDKSYAMAIAVDPHGAGIDSVTLNDYFATADQKESFTYQHPLPGFEAITMPLSTRSIRFSSGQVIDLGSLTWARSAVSASSVTYTATINENGSPLLAITKTYTVPDRKSPGAGFDLEANQSFQNKSNKPITICAIVNGPTIPKRENDRSEDRRYVTGYDEGDKIVGIVHTFVGDLAKDKPAKELAINDKEPALWVGSCNSYFDAIFKPDYAGVDPHAAIQIASASAIGLDPGPKITDPNDPNADPTSLTITTGDFTLAPGATVPFNAHAFFGPKQRQLLKDTPYYSGYPRNYDLTLVYVSKWCGWITFGWLINLLYGILWVFNKVFHDWGLAIIGLVCLVRLLLHPITKRVQINMVKMSKMGPEIERLKKKFGDDKAGFQKAQGALMMEQGVGGFLGCLPMFLQTPIWLALWSALQSTFEMRQAPFLRWGHVHLTWIADLSQPDRLLAFGGFTVPLIGWHIDALNLLPLLMAGVTYVQQALQPAPPNMTPEQQQQRTMMKWMSLVMPVVLYKGPSGLNLYILTSGILGIIESKIVRDHIKQREAAEKAGLVLVDEQPIRRKGKNGKPLPEKQPGKLAMWFADLMAKAEEAKRQNERRAKDRG